MIEAIAVILSFCFSMFSLYFCWDTHRTLKEINKILEKRVV